MWINRELISFLDNEENQNSSEMIEPEQIMENAILYDQEELVAETGELPFDYNSEKEDREDIKKEEGSSIQDDSGQVSNPDRIEIKKNEVIISDEDNKQDFICDNTTEAIDQSPNSDIVGEYGDLSYFGFSIEGLSHKKANAGCQDACLLRHITSKSNMFIAAIADGLGSCKYSDVGANIAIQTAVNFMERQLEENRDPDEDDIVDYLKESMNAALLEVESVAEKNNRSVYEYCSTLTVVVYNENTAFVAHAGDDGVVVINDTGQYGLITTRHKGETASSVMPLQNRDTWEFLIVRNIASVIMATDGVLNSFVHKEKEQNRLLFPFISPLTRLGNKEEDVKNIMSEYLDLFQSDEYQEMVEDDLTFVVIVNSALLAKATFSPFDKEKWLDMNTRRNIEIFKTLYPAQPLTYKTIYGWRNNDKDRILMMLLEKRFKEKPNN